MQKQYVDRFVFEFCPDTAEQQKELNEELRRYDARLGEGKAIDLCKTLSIRCRVFKNDRYVHHIFEDGTKS